MNGLALCAGIGGLEIGVAAAVSGYWCVGYVERDAFAASVLVARMEDSALDPAPVWDDLKSFDGAPWRGSVDIVTAGFPCQPVSQAGNQLGEEDERWLWPDVQRIVGEVEPGLVFLENVPGLVRNGMGTVLGGLADLGFDAEWGLFSAERDGAPHVRRRWFCLAADPDSQHVRTERRGAEPGTGPAEPRHDGEDRDAPDSDSGRREGEREPLRGGIGGQPGDLAHRCAGTWGHDWPTQVAEGLLPQPAVRRVDDVSTYRVDRLRSLGNGVVPVTAARAYEVLSKRMRDRGGRGGSPS